MKKYLKFLILPFVLFMIVFIFKKTSALQKLTVVDISQGHSDTSILYSGGSFYSWADDYTLKLDNVLDFSIYNSNYYPVVLDKQNNLIYHGYEFHTDGVIPDTIKIAGNVKNIRDLSNSHSFNYYLTNDNILYKTEIDIENHVFNSTLIMKDVKSWYDMGNTLIILDINNNLYGYGENIFGSKINNGENIMSKPILIHEDIFSYGNGYFITNSKDLYIIDSRLGYPTKIDVDVKAYIEDYEYHFMYTKENATYYYEYRVENGNLSNIDNFKLLDEETVSVIDDSYGDYILTKNGNLHYYNNNNLKLVSKNVSMINKVDYDSVIYLTNNGEVYESYFDSNFEINKTKYLFKGVSKIIDEDLYLMEDGTIMTRGSRSYDIGNYGGKGHIEYKKLVVIKGLPNVPVNITPKEITIANKEKADVTEGTKYELFSEIYPSNVDNKNVTWSSSNCKIATVDNKGTVNFISPGEVTIKVKLNDYNLSDEIKFKVYSKVNKLEILNGESIKVNKGEEFELNAKLSPDNILKQNIIWSCDSLDENGDEIFDFYTSIDNSTRATAYKTGKYTIKASTEDGSVFDTITVDVVQELTDIHVAPDKNNMLGATLYMYLAESNKMMLNAYGYPEDATNTELVYESSDPSIASVSKNGEVTAYKPGKVTITIKPVSGSAEPFVINVLIFGNDVTVKVGDVNGDGETDVLDLVKLRRHLSGLEVIK